jgi:hypothetical protein
MWEQRELFDGAMVCEMPIPFFDVSDVREVPDHQECWQDVSSFSNSPGSLLVVEILERQGNVGDADAACYFFQDLAESNGATRVEDAQFHPITTEAAVGISNSTSSPVLPFFGAGFQRVEMGRKFDMRGNLRNQPVQWILVELCVIRLPHVGTDLLVTLSTPLDNEPIDSVRAMLDLTLSDKFLHILSTLKIFDWGLFGSD